MKIVWSPLAWSQVENTAEFIFAGDSDGAFDWINRLFDAGAQLEAFPESGRRVPEAPRSDLRELIWQRKYRVVYRLDPDQITVMVFQHGRLPLNPDDLRG